MPIGVPRHHLAHRLALAPALPRPTVPRPTPLTAPVHDRVALVVRHDIKRFRFINGGRMSGI